MKAFVDLCEYLESSEECQFTLQDLYRRMGNASESGCYGEKHLMRLLCAKYGPYVTIATLPGKSSLVCFSGRLSQILSDAWYTAKKKDTLKERERIVETAASIILEDIRKTPYDCSHYPTTDEVTQGGWDTLPSSLRTFLASVINKGKKGDPAGSLRVCNAIGQAIVKAVRPRSYVSPLQTALSVYLHRSFGSRLLIDVLQSLGLCASYSEATQYERAVIEHAPPTLEKSAFVQYAFDNCDFNVRTLDGLNHLPQHGGHQSGHASLERSHRRTCPPQDKSSSS
jgi:hypothetical protein